MQWHSLKGPEISVCPWKRHMAKVREMIKEEKERRNSHVSLSLSAVKLNQI